MQFHSLFLVLFVLCLVLLVFRSLNATGCLISTTPFKSALQRGQKIEAKGPLYREPSESRLNLTSLQTIGSTCVK
jgi:hypothetical protein